MSVLVDTSVWSAAFRRKSPLDSDVAKELIKLIDNFRAKIIGPIRQEILSGIPDKKQFESLRGKLQAFPDEPVETADFETAAEMFNTCRRKGVQGSHTDFLICAVSVHHGLDIFTVDRDFSRYAGLLDIKLHAP